MQQYFGWMRRNKEKKGMGNGKKYKKHRKIKWLRFINKFIDTFLESSSDQDKGNVI